MPTIKIVQRPKQLSNGLNPIYLRITKDRQSKFISLNLSCDTSQWNSQKEEFRKSVKDYIQKNNSLLAIKNRAEKLITDSLSNGIDLTLLEFEDKFLNFKQDKKISLNEFWNQRIEDFIKSGRLGNVRVYKEARNSFFKFLENKTIYFSDVTVGLLDSFEIHLRSRGNMESSISVRMRTIRAIYNDAIKKGLASQEKYPFSKYSVSKLKSESNKRAISINDLNTIRELNIQEYPHLTDTKNYFLFSYFTRGMNFVDMMKLTWENIQSNRIIYTRSKTKGKFTIKILPQVEEILKFYKKQKRDSKYVFPILLKNDLTLSQIENRKEKVLKKFNRELKQIANLCSIDTKITSYVARHSFATILKQKGIATDIISESMGHKNLAITQAYLKELENEVIDDAMEQLI